MLSLLKNIKKILNSYPLKMSVFLIFASFSIGTYLVSFSYTIKWAIIFIILLLAYIIFFPHKNSFLKKLTIFDRWIIKNNFYNKLKRTEINLSLLDLIGLLILLGIISWVIIFLIYKGEYYSWKFADLQYFQMSRLLRITFLPIPVIIAYWQIYLLGRRIMDICNLCQIKPDLNINKKNHIRLRHSLFEREIFAIGFGIFFIMLLTYILGMFHLLYLSFLILVLLLNTILNRKYSTDFLLIFLRGMNHNTIVKLPIVNKLISKKVKKNHIQKNILKKSFIAFPSILSWQFALFMLIMIFFGVWYSGVPQEFPFEWDSLTTYWTLPKAYVNAHEILHFPYWHFSMLPQNGEMLHTFNILLFGTGTSLVFNFSLILLSCIILYNLFFRILTPKRNKIALLVILLLLGNNLFITQALSLKVEMILLFYLFLAVYSLIRMFKQKSIGWLYILTFWLSISFGIKIIYIPFAFATILSGLLYLKSKRKLNYIKTILIICFIGIFTYSPWLIKNYYFTKNPFSPIVFDNLTNSNGAFYSELGTNSLSEFKSKMLADPQLFFHSDMGRRDLFSIFTLYPKLILKSDGLNNFPFNEISIYMLLVPLLIFFFKPNKSTKFLIVIALIYNFVFCLMPVPNAWYSFLLIITLTILSGIVFQNIYKVFRTYIPKFLLYIMVLSLIILTLLNQVKITAWNPQKYYKHNIIEASKFINTNISPNAKIWGTDPKQAFIDNNYNRYIPDWYLGYFHYLLVEKNYDIEIVYYTLKYKLNISYILIHKTRCFHIQVDDNQRISTNFEKNKSGCTEQDIEYNFIKNRIENYTPQEKSQELFSEILISYYYFKKISDIYAEKIYENADYQIVKLK